MKRLKLRSMGVPSLNFLSPFRVDSLSRNRASSILPFNQGVAGSRPARPTKTIADLLSSFLNSGRQGTSPRTLEFYEALLKRFVSSHNLTPTDINHFLASLDCHNGKNAYYRAIRALCNWLYRQGLIEDNPIKCT
jgi:hypothetical protein